jgi:hypothetical protein
LFSFEFQIRTYGFGELAQLYLPHIAKPSASRMFSQWIHTCPQLLQKLIETDWKKRSKYFTPKQDKVVVGILIHLIKSRSYSN